MTGGRGESGGAGDTARSPALRRRTPLAVRGEPVLWLTGMALTASVLMIVALLGAVAVHGFATFWPHHLDEVHLADGSMFLGSPMREEAYDPGPERMAALRAGAAAVPPGALDKDGLPIRRLYRVGNKEILGQPFRWVDRAEIASIERPTNAALFERTQWGVWLGAPEAILLEQKKVLAKGDAGGVALQGMTPTPWGPRRFEREILDETDEGVRVLERVWLAETTAQTWALMPEMIAQAARRRAEIHRLKKGVVGDINRRLERARLVYRTLQIRVDRGRASPDRLGKAQATFEKKQAALQAEYDGVLTRIHALEDHDARYRIVVRDPGTGAIAPLAQTKPDEPMALSQVVRVVRANALGFGGRLGVYLDRWWEFLSADPREANTEGGVFPVIFGTVMLTILLSIIVVPFGVITALYLREYAKQGVVVSVVRIAINNLAGVPSIVYGVFGLGFFCYTLGVWVDNGPTNPWPIGLWLLGGGGTAIIVVGAALVGRLARPKPGQPPGARDKALGWTAAGLWLAALGLFVALVTYSPFFGGFFPARTTFGTKGILWSALTLALLTLPVVVVSTEEAISSAPGSLRQGSYGCGASKWQTVRRIVLPSAAPGVMTGMILAIARGAGEVAPLMLVGAVKLAPELPIEAHFPFVHLERSFMHLGFHIYDLGFQSPDSQAARPMVWTTTLLLILVVVALNLAAIGLRARLRRRVGGGSF